MNFKNTIIGPIIMTIGVAIGYLAYFIVTMFYTVSLWISNYFNAPEALAFIITLALILSFLGLLVLLTIISIIITFFGLSLMLSD